MGLAQMIPPILQFYGFLTAVFAVLYALMYWGARWNVRVLRSMGRPEVDYYYRFIEVVDLARPVALPIGVLVFVGGLIISVLFDGAVARASGLVSFVGYTVLLLLALGWVARKGVEAGERMGPEGVDLFESPLGIPRWIESLMVNYAILGVVFAFFWQEGMFTEWAFAPILWVMVVLGVFVNPVIIYRRYQSLEEQARSPDEA